MSPTLDDSRVKVVTQEEYDELMKPHTRGCQCCEMPFLRYNHKTYAEPCIDGFDKHKFHEQMNSRLDYCEHCHAVSRDLTSSCFAAPKQVFAKKPEALAEYMKIVEETEDMLERKYKLAYFLLQHGVQFGVRPYDIRIGLALYYAQQGKRTAARKLIQEEIAAQEQEAEDVYKYYNNIKYEDLHWACQATSLIPLANLYRRIGEFDKALAVTEFTQRAFKHHARTIGRDSIGDSSNELKLVHKAALNGNAERLICPDKIQKRERKTIHDVYGYIAEEIVDKPRDLTWVFKLIVFVPIILAMWVFMLAWSIVALPIAAIVYGAAMLRWTILKVFYTKLKPPRYGTIYSTLLFEDTARY